MGRYIILKKRGTNLNYQVDVAETSLVDWLNLDAGTYTENERVWTVGRTTDSNKIRITLSATVGAGYAIDTVIDSLSNLGVPVGGLGENSYLTFGYGTFDLIAPDGDPDETYPRYYIMNASDGGSSYWLDYRRTTLSLDVQSGSHYEYVSYHTEAGMRLSTYDMPLVLQNTLGDYVFGQIIVHLTDYSDSVVVAIDVQYSTAVTSLNFVEIEKEAGDKGFKPTGARTTKHKPGNGGRGSSNKKNPDYTSGVINQPGAPDESKASAIGSGLLSVYDVTQANLVELGKALYSDTILTMIANLFVNPLDAIVSLSIFPYTPHIGTSTPIKLLNHQCTVADIGISANGLPLTSQFRVLDFGNVTIGENWGNFLDYSDTQIELYLPFIGCIQLDTSEAMDATVNVQYTIDYITGMCVANVQCSKVVPLPSIMDIPSTSQHSYQGNCAIQIPLSQVSYSNMVGSLMSACTTGLVNPVAGITKLAGDAVSGGLKPSVTTKGSIVGNAGYCSVMYPYIRITRPITAEPDSYQEVVGYPSYINTTLGECSDFCVCDDIDLHTITGATPSELSRIKQYCQSGVHV